MTRHTKLILIMVFLIQCVGIFDHSLWTPDEPRVAEIAREMAVSGDYLIPHHSRQPFLEQPPLYYATAALLFACFSTGNEGFGRLASVLFSIGTLLVIFWGVRKRYGDATAGVAVAILASTVLFLQVSHKMLVDNALGFFITLALFGFLLAYTDRYRYGYVLFWVGMALAFLAKGLIGIAIPGVTVTVFILWQGDIKRIRQVWAAPGILLLLGVIGFWAGILYHAGGSDFLRTFFIYNQVGRFFQSNIYTGGHVRPFYYYLMNFWGDGAPWSLLMLPVIIKTRPLDDTKRFFLAWFLGGLVLLSLASTKRDLYLLPLLPAMAVLIASWMADLAGRKPDTWEKALLLILVGVFILVSAGVPFGYAYALGGTWTVAVMIFGAGALAIGSAYRGLPSDLPRLLVVVWCLLLVIWTPVLIPQIDRYKGYRDLFKQMGALASNQPVAGYRLNESVEAMAPFYGGFFVENIEDRRIFEQFITRRTQAYVIVLPSRLEPGLQKHLQANGVRIISDRARTRRDIELWRIGRGLP